MRNSYTKFRGAARRGDFVIYEKTSGGGYPPPPGGARVKVFRMFNRKGTTYIIYSDILALVVPSSVKWRTNFRFLVPCVVRHWLDNHIQDVPKVLQHLSFPRFTPLPLTYIKVTTVSFLFLYVKKSYFPLRSFANVVKMHDWSRLRQLLNDPGVSRNHVCMSPNAQTGHAARLYALMR